MCDARRRGSVGGSGANVTAVMLALRGSVALRRIEVGFLELEGWVSVRDVRVDDGAVLAGGIAESESGVASELSGDEWEETDSLVSRVNSGR